MNSNTISPFAQQMQFQQRAVARGSKLSSLKFNGIDPDGWIRKSEKYFELVGVTNKDRVKVVVLYIFDKVVFWWRSSRCNANTLP